MSNYYVYTDQRESLPVSYLYGWATTRYVWNDYTPPSARDERCAYCARRRVNATDNCAGCGAPA